MPIGASSRTCSGAERLFDTYVKSYNSSRGTQYSSEEVFDRLTISEQTTFYGITHALMNTR